MNRISRSLRDQRGATAIEYAIIAGLIGLGLVGSLVTTKGSLNAIFGRTSTQLAAPGGGLTVPDVAQRPVAAANTSNRYSFWNPKTLTSKTVQYGSDGASKTTAFAYSDGMTATFTTFYNPDGTVASEKLTTTNVYNVPDILHYTFDANGNPVSQVFYWYYGDGTTVRFTALASASENWREYRTTYNTNGSVSSVDNSSRSLAINNAPGDEIYFRALSSQ